MSNFRVGQFVKSVDNNLGIGKVASVDEDLVTVEYFDSPTSEESPTRTLPAPVVRATELHQETRVYFKHPATGAWFVGRALLKTEEAYRVQFPNRKVGELPESSLYVRWDRPIEDPTDHLANRVNETPYFHEGRAPFRASLVEQRAGCAGMTGLFSSVIELEEHQIEVVRRVLEDPIQRYLLADDVGLGKTIEAGAIMRQYALDRPRDFEILVVVPRHLCEQWEEELAQRFLFDQELGERVHVVPFGETEEILAQGMQAGMMVVDEAHQMARYAHSDDAHKRGIYESIETVSQISDKVLLLSATPVLHNEASYLAMLHLLEPERYRLDDVEAFRATVRERHETARLFYRIQADAAPDELRDVIDDLESHFPGDERLQVLSDGLLECLDGDDEMAVQEAVASLRTHVSETYRLHRRILRTRHTEQTQWLLPGRKEVQVIAYEAPHQAAIEEHLQQWRKAALDAAGDQDERRADYAALFEMLCGGACGLVQTLGRAVDRRLRAVEGDTPAEPAAFDGEAELLKRWRESIEAATVEGRRLQRLVEHIEGLDEDQKLVIFVGDAEDADLVHEELVEAFEFPVVRHHSARHLEDAKWKVFLQAPECRILVCDRRAEEGLNLQGSQAQIVHLDLPLSPNRIEQRIGRLDRYGTGQPVESVIFRPANSELYEALIAWHDDGFGVFTRSVSALAYLIDAKRRQVWPKAFAEGFEVFEADAHALGGDDGEVARELEEVRIHDELDALEASQSTDEAFYDRLWDIDFDAERLEQVAYDWIRNRLQFHRVETEHEHERILRYEYRTERTAKHPTLLPIRELLGRFAVAVDPEVNGFFSYPMSFHRGTACSHQVRVARIGEPFITAVMHYIRWDDRGTSFAMWRHCPREELARDPDLYFRFDFVVEADTRQAVEALKGYQQVTQDAVKLRADGLFPPLMKTVWISAEGAVVEDDVQEVLDLPYDQEGNKRFGRDYNLNSERWERIEELCDPQWWADTCHEARARAEEALVEEVGLEARCQRYAEKAQAIAKRNIDRLQTRMERVDDAAKSPEIAQLELEEALVSALEEGIRQPRIRLDSIGAVFLSTVDPFQEKA